MPRGHLAFKSAQSRTWSSAIANAVPPKLTPQLSCAMEITVMGGLRRTHRGAHQKVLPNSISFSFKAAIVKINTSHKLYTYSSARNIDLLASESATVLQKLLRKKL